MAASVSSRRGCGRLPGWGSPSPESAQLSQVSSPTLSPAGHAVRLIVVEQHRHAVSRQLHSSPRSPSPAGRSSRAPGCSLSRPRRRWAMGKGRWTAGGARLSSRTAAGPDTLRMRSASAAGQPCPPRPAQESAAGENLPSTAPSPLQAGWRRPARPCLSSRAARSRSPPPWRWSAPGSAGPRGQYLRKASDMRRYWKKFPSNVVAQQVPRSTGPPRKQLVHRARTASMASRSATPCAAEADALPRGLSEPPVVPGSSAPAQRAAAGGRRRGPRRWPVPPCPAASSASPKINQGWSPGAQWCSHSPRGQGQQHT